MNCVIPVLINMEKDILNMCLLALRLALAVQRSCSGLSIFMLAVSKRSRATRNFSNELEKRKEIETQKMIALGSKPKKGQKMPIAVGRNIKRKRDRLEEKKLQDELALGLLTNKRAKKSVEKPTASDKGLKASEAVENMGMNNHLVLEMGRIACERAFLVLIM
ncbi:hypothetical protein GOP47_0030251 [Adiantum capillus-veneris]|nr:hypothetical protein GOP47_0030251 [Adiantum capillus-veneris]